MPKSLPQIKPTPRNSTAKAGLSAPAATSVRVSIVALLLVMVTTFIAYWPALSNDFVDWDDTDNYVRNEHFRGLGWSNLKWMFSTFHMGHYQPLSWLTLGWDAVWGQWAYGPHEVHGPGMHARAYHVTSNLLHSANAALVYVLALRLITWPTIRRADVPWWLLHAAAAAAALLFSLHPLRVENVAWITERRDLVSAFLILLTTLAWLKSVHSCEPSATRWLIAAIVLYALSLIAKVAGVPLVAAMLVMDWYPLRRFGTLQNPFAGGSGWKRALIEKVPFVALALLMSFVATAGQSANNWIYPFDRHPLIARVVECFYGLTFYVWKTIVPRDLLPLYELPLPMPWTEAIYLTAVAIVLACSFTLYIFRARLPWLVAAMLCYAAFLGPVLGLFQNGPQIVADRYSYLPAVGPSIVVGASAIAVWRRFRTTGLIVQSVAAVAALAALGVLTWQQTQVWRNTASLWTYNCAKDPGSSFSQNGYGYVLLSAGDVDAAIPRFEEAIRIMPDNRKAHENLWLALERKGDLEALLTAFRQADGIPDRQSLAVSRQGLRLLQHGRPLESIAFFALACQLNPENAETRINYGLALARTNQRDLAEQQYRIAIELNPNLFLARYNSGLNYRAMNRIDEARADLDFAVRLNPNHEGARAALRSLDEADDP